MQHRKNSAFFKRFSFAFSGILQGFKKEASLRIQFSCCLALLVFCLIVRPKPIWCALFAVCSGFVMGLELINTAFESFLDKIHPEYHPQIGFVKDCLAGSVLFASAASLMVFLLFAFEKFF